MARIVPLLASIGLMAVPALAQSPVSAPFKGITGSVTVSPAPKGVLVHVEAAGLTPGWHAAHFHEKADCGDAAFKLAGGHVHGAAPVVHGLLNPAATDNGDLPNLYAGADGSAKAEFFTTALTMAALQDADGSAVVIHAKADDFISQPIGGAGDRVGCAVIR
ncbi:superoxide dismutase family protein [Sphingomonas crusticola]|uniref:superoxide dismutase family protein n=1 Tax=Sphingomonas crusticola TaxID=1697973 RepID=UPI000E2469E1|nr:superoxide dismutase family protein [Sphingomonas crusticola]